MKYRIIERTTGDKKDYKLQEMVSILWVFNYWIDTPLIDIGLMIKHSVSPNVWHIGSVLWWSDIGVLQRFIKSQQEESNRMYRVVKD